jgi:sugar O-acyltransferase (sialic acid O-acetyltransferase NeuD family)
LKNLIIIGARGFGREIFALAQQCAEFNKSFVIKGFLDDKSDALEGFKDYAPILSSVEDYKVKENDVFICALGDVQWKERYSNMILKQNGEFINLIHPTATLSKNVVLGKGIVIFGHSYIGNDTEIGDLVTIQGAVQIGHDVKIGKLSHFNAFSFVGGYCVIEDQVTLNVKASIIPKVTVGFSATVGAHSLVIKNVSPFTSVFGTPAKKMEF